ncbi:hypothetical protein DR950_33155 [Kitasatospora xanthocidica]|uniref:Uncharacterized protein n=1 Tax=Kitasatospora xanthocidica TaxID=83382 RepID=A0A373A1K1_9ACTN|nr:hypothetical protein DR950_33155 [Kitasatospora xanthocidica]
MSTYLALTFGTLLSSQGTDASFGPPSSGPSGLRSFVLPAYQTFSAPFSGVSFIRFPELAGSAFRDVHHITAFRVSLEIHTHP